MSLKCQNLLEIHKFWNSISSSYLEILG